MTGSDSGQVVASTIVTLRPAVNCFRRDDGRFRSVERDDLVSDGAKRWREGSPAALLERAWIEENNKVFGRAQSFVPGSPTNIQFMIKDSKKYAGTGGWGFGHFNKDGTLGNEAFMKTCFPCHAQAKASDLVFTRYAP
jgi:hypothetical protein